MPVLWSNKLQVLDRLALFSSDRLCCSFYFTDLLQILLNVKPECLIVFRLPNTALLLFSPLTYHYITIFVLLIDRSQHPLETTFSIYKIGLMHLDNGHKNFRKSKSIQGLICTFSRVFHWPFHHEFEKNNEKHFFLQVTDKTFQIIIR